MHKHLTTVVVALVSSMHLLAAAHATAQAPALMPVTRAAAVDDEGPPDLGRLAGRRAWRQLDVEQRHALRREREAELFDAARADVLDDWIVLESHACLLLSQHDKRETKRKLDELEDCWDWVDERFAALSDDVVRRPIVRYFAKEASFRSYNHSGARGDDEILLVLVNDPDGRRWITEGAYLAPLVWHYVWQKLEGRGPPPGNPRLMAWSDDWLPPWISMGLGITGMPDEDGRWHRAEPAHETLDEAYKGDALRTAREIMALTAADLRALPREERLLAQRQALALLLHCSALDKRGDRSLRGFLPRYLRRSAELREDALAAALAPSDADAPPEREIEAIEAIDGEGPAGQAAWLRALNDEFCNWSDRDWTSFERAYLKTMR